MPYIQPTHRTVLDPAIHELSKRIAELAAAMPEETAFAGLINYACTSLAMQVIEARFGRLRYGTIATLTGVFKNIADEFYRRVAAPYEERQREKNGDVTLFERYARRLSSFDTKRRRPDISGICAMRTMGGRYWAHRCSIDDECGFRQGFREL